MPITDPHRRPRDAKVTRLQTRTPDSGASRLQTRRLPDFRPSTMLNTIALSIRALTAVARGSPAAGEPAGRTRSSGRRMGAGHRSRRFVPGGVAAGRGLASGEGRRVVERAVCRPARLRRRRVVPHAVHRAGIESLPARAAALWRRRLPGRRVRERRRRPAATRGRTRRSRSTSPAGSSPAPTSWSSASWIRRRRAAAATRGFRSSTTTSCRAASRTGTSRTAGSGSRCGSTSARRSISTRCACRRRCQAPSTSTPNWSARAQRAVSR